VLRRSRIGCCSALDHILGQVNGAARLCRSSQHSGPATRGIIGYARQLFHQERRKGGHPHVDEMSYFRTNAPQRSGVYSISSLARVSAGSFGHPRFRRPSINSFAFGYPPRAIHVDMVKAGSS
jgi:hypothetical protein